MKNCILAMIGAFAGVICAVPTAAQNDLRLALPQTIYAAPGIETNVYFDNVALVLDTSDYAFDVDCEKGAQFSECWRYVPAEEDAGDYPFKLTVRNGRNEVVASGTATVRVTPGNAGAGASVSLLLIGDSLTHASVYTQHLLNLCAGDGGPTVSLVGSHGKDDPLGPNRHEGYGGWTAEKFATRYTGIARTGYYKERGSPFLYELENGERVLDFRRYCDDVNAGALPDFAVVFLGCNDVFGADDDSIEERIDAMFAHLDALIALFREDAPGMHIALMPPVPPAASQDAFGADYECGQTRWQYRRNQHRVVERMHERYAGAAGISFVPAYVNLDCVRNFPGAAQPASARNETEIVRQTNGVHPAATGYRQIGDSVYCWLKSRFPAADQPEEQTP